MASARYEQLKYYYKKRLWSEARITAAVTAMWITQEEADEILGNI